MKLLTQSLLPGADSVRVFHLSVAVIEEDFTWAPAEQKDSQRQYKKLFWPIQEQMNTLHTDATRHPCRTGGEQNVMVTFEGLPR